jgi:hypothetical protein
MRGTSSAGGEGNNTETLQLTAARTTNNQLLHSNCRQQLASPRVRKPRNGKYDIQNKYRDGGIYVLHKLPAYGVSKQWCSSVPLKHGVNIKHLLSITGLLGVDLTTTFINTRVEVTGEWRRLHNEELNDRYSLPNIMRVVKSRMRWAGHVARMGEERGVHRVLVGKPEGKSPLGRPRCRWEDNIKMDVQEVGGGRGYWKELAQDRDVWRARVSMVKNLRVL